MVNDRFKIFRSKDYNFNFDLRSGLFQRWGETEEDDPSWSPYGPEIADIEITTSCFGIKNKVCNFCSPAGTLINTPHGKMCIEKVKVGDDVIGYDTTFNRPQLQEVKETYERWFAGDLICIEIEDGNVIKLTPNHKIYTKNKGWVVAGELTENDVLVKF